VIGLAIGSRPLWSLRSPSRRADGELRAPPVSVTRRRHIPIVEQANIVNHGRVSNPVTVQ